MDNTETKTTTEQKAGAGKIIFILIGVAALAFVVWRLVEQAKIDRAMKKVREAKAARNAVENAGESV